jgi:hypothetical protein
MASFVIPAPAFAGINSSGNPENFHKMLDTWMPAGVYPALDAGWA